MKFTVHIIISIFFALLITIVSIWNNIGLLTGNQNEDVSTTVYFKVSSSEEDVKSFIDQIKKNYKTEKIDFVSKDTALEDFKKTFGDFSKNISSLDNINDLIPYSVEIVFFDTYEKNNFLQKINSYEEVDEVIAHDKIFFKYKTLQKSLNLFLFIFFGTAFVICSVLTALLVKNIINKDQRTIEIFSLFGKSYAEVIRAYFIKFSRYLIYTISLAFCLTYLFYFLFKLKLGAVDDFSFLAERVHFLSFKQAVFLCIGFVLSYFIGLYGVLRVSIRRTFNR
ncbi:MAG: cell division protein FtsX [Pseudobdellovibrio sp.]